MKYLAYIALATLVLVIACQCKDDDLNPCEVEGVQPVNAVFQVYDEIGWGDSIRLIEGDTFINDRILFFIAEQEAATYQWKIGDDPRIFEEKEFTLYFQGLEGPVAIQLIVEAPPNVECFPEDDGRDTLIQTIYFVNPEESPLFGQFRGVVSSAPNDTFEIDVQLIAPDDETNIDNFPKGCIRDNLIQLRFFFSYRYLVMKTFGNYMECPKPQGWGYVDNDGILHLDYVIWDTNIQQHVADSFTGKKIN